MLRKKHLAMILSKLEGFHNPKPDLEQYRTPGDVAAELLWIASGDIRGSTVADLGAGTGVLTVGACLMGAKEVYAVEIDPEAIEVLGRNLESLGLSGKVRVLREDVAEFSDRVDVVVMNPPFGSQNPHSDRPFLSKAFEVADVVYSIHLAKPEVRGFIKAFAIDHGFMPDLIKTLQFEIPAIFSFHRRRLERIKVDIYRLYVEPR